MRYFTFVDQKTQCSSGRYRGLTPLQAARKCASKRFQKIKTTGGDINKEITIVIREITRGSHRKYFAYEAKKITFNNNTSVIFGSNFGSNTVVNFKGLIKIKKIDLPNIFNTKVKINNYYLKPELANIVSNNLIIEV